MSYIGVDYGTRRVGIAVSDESGVLAFPAEVVAEREAVARIAALARDREARGIVIGESKNFDGRDNPVMARIRVFAKKVNAATGIKIFFEPEFMTSAAAMREGETAEEKIDASAAALILQSFLDKGGQGTINTAPSGHASRD